MNDHTEPHQDDPVQDGLPEVENSVEGDVVVPYARPVVMGSGADIYVTPQLAESCEFYLFSSTRKTALMDAGLLCLLLLGFEFIFQLAIGLYLGFLSSGNSEGVESIPENFARDIMIPFLVVRAATAVFIIWAILRHRKQTFASIGFEKSKSILNTIIGIASTPVVGAIIFVTMSVTMLLLPDLIEQMEENVSRIKGMVPILHPIYMLFFASVIAIYEEFIFRGFLLSRLRRWTNSWVWSVIISTMIFTSLHAMDQVVIAMIPVAILSITFSLLTIWRRSIVPAMVCHMLWDWSQFIFLYYESQDILP